MKSEDKLRNIKDCQIVVINGRENNTFENVEYKGIDLNGNRYVLKSESADFESSMPELVNMKVMVAIFYFKDGKQ